MKRSIKTFVLLMVLAALVGGYYMIQNMEQTTQVTEESGTFDLTAKTGDDLTGISWSLDSVDYHFTKTDGEWVNAADMAFPVEQDAIQTLADQLVNLTASRKLEDISDLAGYGLAEPVFTVTAIWSDGTSTTYSMGDETPFGDGYYLSVGQSDIAYTISSSLSSTFNKSMNDFAAMESIPTVESVTRLVVGKNLDAVWEETSHTINADQHWYDTNGYALDGVDDLISDAQAIAWDELVEPAATEEELVEWALDDEAATAIVLYDGDTEAVKLLLGSIDEAGDYYARLPESAMVYTVASSDVSNLLSATPDSLRSMTLVETSYDELQEASFIAGSLSYTIASAAEVEADDEEQEAATSTNADLWDALTAITATSMLDDMPAGDSVLNVSITTTGGNSAEMAFYEHDVDSYTVVMDTRAMLVSADKVDKLIRIMKTAQ